jgi:chromosome segregation ATPase
MKIIALVFAPLLLIGLIVAVVFWRGSAGQAQSLAKALSQAQAQIEALETQAKNMIQKNDSLGASLKEAEGNAAKSAEALRAKDSELSSLRAANSSLTSERARLTAEAQKVGDAAKKAESAAAEATAYRERLAKQEAQVTVLSAERDKLHSELEQAKKTINLLDLSNAEIVSSLGFLGRPVMEPDMLPPLTDSELY